jgi:hypothetical protein
MLVVREYAADKTLALGNEVMIKVICIGYMLIILRRCSVDEGVGVRYSTLPKQPNKLSDSLSEKERQKHNLSNIQ